MEQSEFIKGKWYEWYIGRTKSPTGLWMVKGDYVEGNKLYYKERINVSGIYNPKNSFCEWDDEMRLADMTEVSKFLPDGHVDKIVGLPEEYIVDCTGTLYAASEEVAKYYYKDTNVRLHWNYIICCNDYDGRTEVLRCDDKNHSRFICKQHLPIFTYDQWLKLKNNNMKVEAPKTFAIKSDSKHLLKACWEELESMGYKRSFMSRDREFKDFICNNLNRVKTTSSKDEYSEIYINGNVTITAEVVFTLPQDYNKAIEYAKSAINSEYWDQNKAKKMKFGSLEIDVEKGKGYVDIAEGRITKEDLKKVIDWTENRPKILGYNLEISMDDSTFKFGCKHGKYQEIKDIYEAM